MISVSKTVDIRAPAADVWKTVGDFGSAASYLPVVERCDLRGEGSNIARVLHLKDGGTFIERLVIVSGSDRSLRYAIVDSPLPVGDYVSTMRVDTVDPQRCRVTWSSTFEARGASEGDARAVVEGIYRMGLDGLQKLHEA
jgi:hypothetical protein